MAESIVQVTTGAGPKLHTFQRTIGANNVEDEVVIQGEPYLASYTVINGPSTATANSHLMQIMAGASNKVRIRRIEIHQSTLATAAALMQVVIVRLSTAGTGGTALTPMALDPADAAAGFTAMTLPTVKGTEAGAANIFSGVGYMMQTLGASNQLVEPILTINFDNWRTKPLIIAAGVTNGIAIKNITAVAAGVVAINVWTDETSFG